MQSGSIFCIKHPPKSSKFSACGGPEIFKPKIFKTQCFSYFPQSTRKNRLISHNPAGHPPTPGGVPTLLSKTQFFQKIPIIRKFLVFSKNPDFFQKIPIIRKFLVFSKNPYNSKISSFFKNPYNSKISSFYSKIVSFFKKSL